LTGAWPIFDVSPVDERIGGDCALIANAIRRSLKTDPGSPGQALLIDFIEPKSPPKDHCGERTKGTAFGKY
jgi:hypothetical protein